jgi:hypothetical protein
MDMLTGVLLVVGVTFVALFNYYLNKAPGSEPEDFRVGPAELGITCDCYLNTVIVSAIAVIAIIANAGAFSSITELVAAGATAFVIITLAGVIGRRHRYRDWYHMKRVLIRSVPSVSEGRPSSVDISFDDDDNDNH